MSDLAQYMEPVQTGERRLAVECVMDESLYRRLGKPEFCHPFRNGFVWTRYYGEVYKPLYANDQAELNSMCKKLFPEYFAE